MNILLQLNLAVRDNYTFFCPDAPLHLSLSDPKGYSPRLTGSILRGLRAGTLIDVKGVVDIKKGELKEIKEPEKVEEDPDDNADDTNTDVEDSDDADDEAANTEEETVEEETVEEKTAEEETEEITSTEETTPKAKRTRKPSAK